MTAPTPNISSVTKALWERTASSLSREELKWFAGAAEHGRYVNRYLIHMIEGIGCLVAEDGRHKTRAGNFQSADDVAELLFWIAESLDHAEALTAIGDLAANQLNPL